MNGKKSAPKKGTSTLNELHTLLKTRLSMARRFGKNRMDLVKRWQKDYNITTIADAKFENLDNQIQIPYIFSTVESGEANVFEQFPSIIMKQRGREDREFTDFAEQIWDYLNDKLALEEIIEDAGLLFLNNGQSTVRYGWEAETTMVPMPQTDPSTGKEMVDPTTGQPVTQDVPVLTKNMPYACLQEEKTLFFSPESKFVIDDDRNHIPFALWMQTLTKDQAEEYYGVTVEDSELETIDIDSFDKSVQTNKMTPNEQGSESNDLKRVKVYSYVGMLPKDQIPKELQDTYKADNVYYIVFSKEKIYKPPEQITKKPLLNMGNYGLPTEFWRFGEAKVLRELEQDISLGRSRIMDLRDRQGTKVAIPQSTEFDEASFKKSRDYTFMRYIGNNPPQYINPPPIPETIMQSINMSRDDVQMASATMDISRASMSDTVNTATGQKIFAAETNKRNGRKKKKIARFIKALAKNLLILCGQNWDESEFAKITDIPEDDIKQQGWKQKLADLGEDYDVEIDIDTMGDTKVQDAANALAMYREMKDDQAVNHDELVKFVLKVGFRQKDGSRFLSNNVSPEMIMAVLKYLLENQVIAPEDAQMIAQKMDAVQQQGQQGQPENPAAPTGPEGRPPVASPTEIMNNKMPGTDANQMTAQQGAAYKQTNVPKGPQTPRR